MNWDNVGTGFFWLIIAIVLLGMGNNCGKYLERQAWINGERRIVDGRLWLKDADGWKTDQPLPAPPAPAQPEKAQ